MCITETLSWNFSNTAPTENMIKLWDELSDQNEKSVASSYYKFTELSNLSMGNGGIIYAYAYCNSQLVAAIPLFRKNKKISLFRSNTLQIVNHSHMDIYVPAKKKELSQQVLFISLFTALKKQVKHWNYFHVRNLLHEGFEDKSFLMKSYNQRSAFYNLNNINCLKQLISKKLLKNINRHQKKLTSDKKSITIESYENESNIQKAIDLFFEVENSGWKKRTKTSILSNPSTKNFYNELWNNFISRKKGVIYLLYLDHEVIAGAIAFTHNKCQYLHKIAFKEDYANFGPGSILIKEIIDLAINNRKIETICFNTYPKWLNRWHPDAHSLIALEDFNSNLKSKIIKLIITSLDLLRILKRKIKPQE